MRLVQGAGAAALLVISIAMPVAGSNCQELWIERDQVAAFFRVFCGSICIDFASFARLDEAINRTEMTETSASCASAASCIGSAIWVGTVHGLEWIGTTR